MDHWGSCGERDFKGCGGEPPHLWVCPMKVMSRNGKEGRGYQILVEDFSFKYRHILR
jgi:hypothetical protein